MRVVILRGTPGAGKSTYTRNHFPTAAVCSADDFFLMGGVYKFDAARLSEAHGYCLRLFNELIQKNTQLIVVDNTNISALEVSPYAALANAYGYELNIITLLVDPAVAAQRNVHAVDLKTVKRQRARLDAGTRQLPHWWKHTVVEL